MFLFDFQEYLYQLGEKTNVNKTLKLFQSTTEHQHFRPRTEQKFTTFMFKLK